MITSLASLGAKYRLMFVPEYSDDGTRVDVAVIFSLKSEKADEAVPKTLTFSGTIAEVEESLKADMPKAVSKLSAHATSLDELDKQLEADKKENEKSRAVEASKKKAIADKSVKDSAKPARDKPQPKPDPEPQPAEPPIAKEKPADAPKAVPLLKPAWSAKKSGPAPVAQPPVAEVAVAEVAAPAAAEEEAPDLGSLFG
jgi:hypothetical protein